MIDLKSKPIIISIALSVVLVVLGVVLVFYTIVLRGKRSSIKKTTLQNSLYAPGNVEEGDPRLKKVTEGEMKKVMSRRPKVVKVAIKKDGFEPKEVKVKPFDIVTWTNLDTAPHQVQGASGKWGSALETKPEKSFSYEFDVPGIYDYFDAQNPTVRGRIIVEQ